METETVAAIDKLSALLEQKHWILVEVRKFDKNLLKIAPPFS